MTGSALKQRASARPTTSEPVESTTPDDVAEEDLAYLKILALVREKRKEEAALAAKEYLRRFPAGFRRPKIESLTR